MKVGISLLLPAICRWARTCPVVGHGGDQGSGRLSRDAGASRCRALDGDDLSSRGRGLAVLEESADGAVEGVAVRGGQGGTDGRGMGRADQAGQRMRAGTEQGQSVTHSPIAVIEAALAKTAEAAAVSRAVQGWRMPRRARGSGTVAM